MDKHEHAEQRKYSKRQLLALGGVYSIAYDWANHKKNLGMMIGNKYRTHKQYLRKHKLGKFKKSA